MLKLTNTYISKMSFVHVVQSTASGSHTTGSAAERTSFVGARIPQEIKRLPKTLKQLDRQTFRKILRVLAQSLEGSDGVDESYSCIPSKAITEETVAIVFSGLDKLVQCALRQPAGSLKKEIFCDDLVQIGIQEEFIADLANTVFGPKQEALRQSALDSCPRLPGLDNLRWRVDVAISTSSLSRVLEPTVTMEMTTSDGKVHRFEVGVRELQLLRYNVAEVLKEMGGLEGRSILKVA